MLLLHISVMAKHVSIHRGGKPTGQCPHRQSCGHPDQASCRCASENGRQRAHQRLGCTIHLETRPVAKTLTRARQAAEQKEQAGEQKQGTKRPEHELSHLDRVTEEALLDVSLLHLIQVKLEANRGGPRAKRPRLLVCRRGAHGLPLLLPSHTNQGYEREEGERLKALEEHNRQRAPLQVGRSDGEKHIRNKVSSMDDESISRAAHQARAALVHLSGLHAKSRDHIVLRLRQLFVHLQSIAAHHISATATSTVKNTSKCARLLSAQTQSEHINVQYATALYIDSTHRIALFYFQLQERQLEHNIRSQSHCCQTRAEVCPQWLLCHVTSWLTKTALRSARVDASRAPASAVRSLSPPSYQRSSTTPRRGQYIIINIISSL